jgi:hypothetical protein
VRELCRILGGSIEERATECPFPALGVVQFTISPEAPPIPAFIFSAPWEIHSTHSTEQVRKLISQGEAGDMLAELVIFAVVLPEPEPEPAASVDDIDDAAMAAAAADAEASAEEQPLSRKRSASPIEDVTGSLGLKRTKHE